jgi:hypothetical protein
MLLAVSNSPRLARRTARCESAPASATRLPVAVEQLLGARDRLVDRHRPEVVTRQRPEDHLALLPAVLGTARVEQGALADLGQLGVPVFH